MDSDHISKTYVIFSLGNLYFGVCVDQVIEVLQYVEIAEVPQSPSFILGVTNFRGEVVTVINLHQRFFKKNTEATIKQSILIMDLGDEYEESYIGVRVDKVLNVCDIKLKDISNAPESGFNFNPEYLDGVYCNDNKVILMINAIKVLSEEELHSSFELNKNFING